MICTHKRTFWTRKAQQKRCRIVATTSQQTNMTDNTNKDVAEMLQQCHSKRIRLDNTNNNTTTRRTQWQLNGSAKYNCWQRKTSVVAADCSTTLTINFTQTGFVTASLTQSQAITHHANRQPQAGRSPIYSPDWPSYLKSTEQGHLATGTLPLSPIKTPFVSSQAVEQSHLVSWLCHSEWVSRV